MGLEDGSGGLGDIRVIAEGEVEEYVHGSTTLHVGEEFEGELGCDFRDGGLVEDDFLEEVGFFTGGGCGAGKGVVDEELEGVLVVFVGGIFDLGDDLGEEIGAIDGLGVQSLFFTVCNFLEVVLVEAH